MNTYLDWKNTTFNTNGSLSNAPDSCCTQVHEGCGKNQLTNNGTIYHTGCITAFGDSIEDHAYIVGGVGAGLGLLQIIALIVSCCLAKKMRASERENDNYD